MRRGLVATANTGQNDNGSQFFFTLGRADELHGKHTIFGKVRSVLVVLYHPLLVQSNHQSHMILNNLVLNLFFSFDPFLIQDPTITSCMETLSSYETYLSVNCQLN